VGEGSLIFSPPSGEAGVVGTSKNEASSSSVSCGGPNIHDEERRKENQ